MAEQLSFRNCLRYVRERRNLTLQGVAEELNTSTEKLEKFERGDAVPTLRQLEILQSIYGIPDYVLMGDEKPDVPTPILDLRQSEATPLEISPKGLKALFKRLETAELIDSIAQSLQLFPPRRRPSEINIKNINKHADDFYNLFGLDPREPTWIANPELAFRHLRANIEQYGIYCFLSEVPPTDYRGVFTRINDRASLIIINKRTFKIKARLFTLLHEFAHFLIKVEGISDPLIINNSVERACNKFASEFLAPSDLISNLFHQASSTKRSTSQVVSYISQRCLLSNGATAYRLRSEHLISDQEYRTWFARNGMPTDYGGEDTQSDLEEPASGGGGRYAYNVLSDFGFRPLQILERAALQGAIDDVNVARIINARGETQELVFKTLKDRLSELDL